MGFQGYFVKVGSYEIPLNYMNSTTYKAQKNRVVVGSYLDANGVTHEDVYEHTPCRAEFETPQAMVGTDFNVLMEGISANYINERERRASVTVFVPEINDYVTQEMCVEEIVPVILNILNDELYYNPICLAFIGY